MWLKITTGQTLDSKFVPSSLNVRTTAGETGMLSGHWFPPHITSLAGYINYIVNVRHSYICGRLNQKYHFIIHFNPFHVYVKLTKYHLVTCKTCLFTLLALVCAIQLGFLYVVKITTGQTLDSKFVPNSLNVRTTAGGRI